MTDDDDDSEDLICCAGVGLSFLASLIFPLGPVKFFLIFESSVRLNFLLSHL